MSETIYAAFHDPEQAERAASALLQRGVSAGAISLVLSESAKKHSAFRPTDEELEYSTPQTLVGNDGNALQSHYDPLGNDMRTAPYHIQGGDISQSDLDVTTELNPALDDYPRSPNATGEEMTSRPPNAPTDYNRDLDTRQYNADYETEAQRLGDEDPVDAEIREELARDRERASQASSGATKDVMGRRVYPMTNTDKAGPVNPTNVDEHDLAKLEEAGVTHTTLHDSAKTVAKSAAAGLGVGALAAVAAIAIPGAGLIIGGGALATALAAIAASAGAGAVAGGVVGYLKDHGVDPNDIPRYQKAFEDGGAILSVSLEGIERSDVEALLREYGGANVHLYGYVA